MKDEKTKGQKHRLQPQQDVEKRNPNQLQSQSHLELELDAGSSASSLPQLTISPIKRKDNEKKSISPGVVENEDLTVSKLVTTRQSQGSKNRTPLELSIAEQSGKVGESEESAIAGSQHTERAPQMTLPSTESEEILIPDVLTSKFLSSPSLFSITPQTDANAQLPIHVASANQILNLSLTFENNTNNPCKPLRINPLRTVKCPKRISSTKSRFSKSDQRQLSDFVVLAEACHRAGKSKSEGAAYFGMGVVYDNAQMYEKAIECYQKYLTISIELNDQQSEILAYNLIGVDCHLMGAQFRPQAYYCYSRHLSKSNDPSEKFTTHVNLGLLHNAQGGYKLAVRNYRNALKYATQLEDKEKQAIAVVNLGITECLRGHFEAAEGFMKRYLHLSNDLQDHIGQSRAHQNLGLISTEEEQFDKAQKHFEDAIAIAQTLNNINIDGSQSELISNCRVSLGVIAGRRKFQTFMEKTVSGPNELNGL